MKKILMRSFVLLLGPSIFCQQLKPTELLTKKDYVQKSQSYKIAGWIVLCGGVGIIAEGIMNYEPQEKFNNSLDKLFVNPIVNKILGGIVISFISIPFFNQAAKLKNKFPGLSTSLKMEKIFFIEGKQIIQNSFPAVNLKINLR